MRWSWTDWRQRRDSCDADKEDPQEAERIVAAIFSPAHAAAKQTADSDGAILRRSAVRLFKTKKEEEVHTPQTEAAPKVEKQEDHRSWRDIPASPIVGYVLREEGLVDELGQPVRVLDKHDMRCLIDELAAIEQKAQYVVDDQLPLQVHNRSRRGMQLFVNPCLFVCGLYLMCWKAPRLYSSATPRSSIFFTRVLSLLRWSLPEVQKEQIARKHRRVLQASNARVTLSFLSGCAMTSVAAFTHQSSGAMDVGPDVDLGKQSVGFQKHSEGALRWLCGMPLYTAPDFSEDLFSVVLDSCTPSRVRVEAITQLALSHLPRAVDVWAALRKALVRQEDLESDKNRALWYVLDSLIKHAPHVFVPLVAPRLHDYVLQHLPWDVVRKNKTSAADGLWCDAMIRSWEGLLPPNVFHAVRSFLIQLRSERQMATAMGRTGSEGAEGRAGGAGGAEGGGAGPAGPEELRRLRESWATIRSFAAAGRDAAEPPEPAVSPSPAANRQSEGRPEASGGGGEEESDSDGEYVPELMPGARLRELPSLFGPGEAKPRRAARRRPREEE